MTADPRSHSHHHSGQSALVRFAYELTGTGWARARIADDENSIELPASYLTDTLTELLLALGAIQEGAGSAECSWEEEPGEYRWIFTRQGEQLTLKILAFMSSFPRRSDEEGEAVFECQAHTADMVRAFTTGIRAVLTEWGEDGYLARWVQYPFPTELLELVEATIASA